MNDLTNFEYGMIVSVDGDLGIVTEIADNNKASIHWFNTESDNREAWWSIDEVEIIADPAQKYRETEEQRLEETPTFLITYPDGTTEYQDAESETVLEMVWEWIDMSSYTIDEEDSLYDWNCQDELDETGETSIDLVELRDGKTPAYIEIKRVEDQTEED